MLVTVNGIILRETAVGENDKMLTLLSGERGKMSVFARNVRSVKNTAMSQVQLFSYGEFVLSSTSDKYYLRECNIAETFYPLREELSRLALGSYLLDVAADISVEEMPCEDVLPLLLNSLYLLMKGEKPPSQIKAVFELRAASLSGFAPTTSACRKCGSFTASEYFFKISDADVLCRACRDKEAGKLVPEFPDFPEYREEIVCISPDVFYAIRFIVFAPAKKIFSFSLPEEEMAVLGRLCEKYLLFHLERGFASLDFYKNTLL